MGDPKASAGPVPQDGQPIAELGQMVPVQHPIQNTVSYFLSGRGTRPLFLYSPSNFKSLFYSDLTPFIRSGNTKDTAIMLDDDGDVNFGGREDEARRNYGRRSTSVE